jgi:hypothetical protein
MCGRPSAHEGGGSGLSLAVLALLIGLLLIICLPELSLTIPRSAGFVR